MRHELAMTCAGSQSISVRYEKFMVCGSSEKEREEGTVERVRDLSLLVIQHEVLRHNPISEPKGRGCMETRRCVVRGRRLHFLTPTISRPAQTGDSTAPFRPRGLAKRRPDDL